MKERAFNDYGFTDYVPDETELKDLWNWIRINKSLEETLMIPTHRRLFGINQLFKSSQNETYLKKILNSTICKSDSSYVEWYGLDPNISVKVKIYKSEQRRRGLLLCGWCDNLDDHQGIYKLIDELESKGEFTRAAAISIFNLNLKRAIDCLTKCASTPAEHGGNENYTTLAMALSGYTGNFNNSLWHDIGKSIKSKFDDVYLKSIIYFLTSDKDSYYDEILYENNLKLSDRLAFALIFLPDHELDEYIIKQTKSFIDQGNILGLLFVGLTEDGLKLMQNYVERTSDIQTVSLIVLNGLPNPVYKHEQVNIWIQNYKEYLDRLRLWNLTAKFNINWCKNLPEDDEMRPYQIFVNCNFCGYNISSHLQQTTSAKLQNASGHCGRVSISAASNKKRIQSCPNCTKPLPRCSLCACHLGTPTSFYSKHNAQDDVLKIDDSVKKLSPFSNWFSWCQSCRHGGHSKHLLEWFSKNIECAVSGCSCKCFTLDHNSLRLF